MSACDVGVDGVVQIVPLAWLAWFSDSQNSSFRSRCPLQTAPENPLNRQKTHIVSIPLGLVGMIPALLIKMSTP